MAYTSAMTRFILATLASSLIVATSANAQLKITLPAQRYKVHDQIRAKVENILAFDFYGKCVNQF